MFRRLLSARALLALLDSTRPALAVAITASSGPPAGRGDAHRRSVLVLALATAMVAMALPAPADAASYFYARPFAVRILPADKLPYAKGLIPVGPPAGAYLDADGIPRQLYDGKLVYKPAGLAQLGITYVEAYRRTNDPMHLEWASKIALKLDSLAVVSGTARYLPYRMTFPMHGNRLDLMRNPWYSGMAQGLQLSLLVRLFEVTGDAKYRDVSVPYWNSIRHLRSTGTWVTWVERSYLWVEEYPQAAPEHTLNGFMFAIVGIYDYWRMTSDPVALRYVRGTLTTLRAYILRYRNPGGPADYCLKHGKPQGKYHDVVTKQLRQMALISGDSYFTSVANLFAQDYVYR
jgi:hypothetical protein